MAKTLGAHQIADALTSVPGVAFNVLRKIPVSDIAVDSTSFVDVGSGADKMEATFEAPVAGSYLFTVNVHSGQIGGSSSLGQTAYWQLVFDAAGTLPQTFQDDAWCSVYVNQYNRKNSTFVVGPVELTTGSHTVLVQAKNQYASRAIQIASVADEHVIIDALLVSGSGAGGTLVEREYLNGYLVSTQEGSGGQEVTQLTKIVTTVEGEQLLLTFQGSFETGSSSDTNWYVGIRIDDTYMDGSEWNINETHYGYGSNASWSVFTPPLSAGNHEIKIYMARHDTQSNFTIYHSVYCIARFRGGMVPVQQAGTSIVDTPRAFNFLGAAVENNNGVADIHLGASAPGTRIYVSDGQPNSTIAIGSSDTKIMPEDESSMTFNVPTTGTYKLTFYVSFFSDTVNTSGQVKLVFDESTDDVQTFGYNDQWQTRVINATYGSLTAVEEIYLTAGNHTVTAYAKEVDGTTLEVIGVAERPAATPWLELVLVTGSGAGGSIVTKDVLTSNESGLTSSRPPTTAVPNLSVTVDCVVGENLFLSFDGFAQDNVGNDSIGLTFAVDGAAVLDEQVVETISASGHAANLSFSHRFVATRTQHVITLLYGVDAGGSYTIWADAELSVTQYRGGLVPVQQAGTTKVSTPAALNFIGADVQNTGGVADISLPAAVTTSGNLVRVTADQPASNILIGSSYTQFFPDSSGSSSLVIPTSGHYRVTFSGVVWGNGAAGTAQIEIRINEGESDHVEVGGDTDDSWRMRVHTGALSSFTVVGEAELTAGTYTLKAYGKNIDGTGPTVFGTAAAPGVDLVADFMLVSGSGAGGVLVEEDKVTSIITLPTGSPGTLTDIFTFDVNVSGPEDEVTIIGYIAMRPAATATGDYEIHFRLYDDTAYLNETSCWKRVSFTARDYDSYPIPIAHSIRGLSAGNHTLKIKGENWSTSLAFTVRGGANGDYSYARAIMYRGGLVPIRDNSVTVTDTPAAIDFVGDNVSVTNVGGVAKVEFNGVAEGVETVDVSLAANEVVNWTSYAPFSTNPMTINVEGSAGETVIISYGVVWSPGSPTYATYFQPYVDDVATGRVQRQALVTGAVSDSFPYTFTTSGTHTVELWAQVASGGSTTVQSFGTNLRVTKIKGGFIKPENVPVFERDSSDTSVINATAAIGADSEMRLQLNDGVRRTATLPLTCDIDVDGIGGRDTGDASEEAAGDLYHLYAVESDTDSTEIKLVLSKDAVPGTSGPPSYSIHRCLWTVRIDSIGPVVIERFGMTEDGCYYPSNKNDTDYTIDSLSGTGPGTVGSWIDKSSVVQALVPPSADRVLYRGYADSTLSGEQHLYLSADASGSWTPNGGQPYSQRFLSCGYSNGAVVNRQWVEARSLAIQWKSSQNTYASIDVDGYHNALYPGNKMVQAQAPYTPSTLWRYLSPTELPTGAAAPEAVWQFDGSGTQLDDKTANNHDLTVETGTLRYTSAEGMMGLMSSNSFTLSDASASAGLRTSGAITVAALVLFETTGSSKIVTCSALGETEDTNYLYRWRVENNLVYVMTEYGAGTNEQIAFLNIGIPTGRICHFVATRSSDGLTYKIYLDGKLLETQVAGNAPSGGSSDTFRIFGDYSGSEFQGAIFSLLVAKEEWSAAQALESYQYCHKLMS